MTINLYGPLLGCKFAIPHMRAVGGGSIINTSSSSGQTADRAMPAYGASKAALIMLTKHVATAYGCQGIRCNAIAPGPVETPTSVARLSDDRRASLIRSTALGRMAAPSEIGEVAAFLASDASSYLTGQVVGVDGGLLCHQPFVGYEAE